MKKEGLFLTIVLAVLITVSGNLYATEVDYSKFNRTDSALVLNWNAADSTWIPSSVVLYQYEDDHIITALTVDYYTRAKQAKTENYYGSSDHPEIQTNFYYRDGWKTSTRNVYTYDTQDRVSQIEIQKWADSVWVTDRIQNNYVYNESDKQLEFQLIYWRFNNWTQPETDYSYYDDKDRLIKREGIYATGMMDYQIIYSYDASDLLTETYAHYPVSSGWANWWLANYQYNQCGTKISQVQYVGAGTGWKPASKTVFFTSFNYDLLPGRKVPICHRGHTIFVARQAVSAHLAHGDCIGECNPEKYCDSHRKRDDNKNFNEIPFRVYPNPADGQFSIKKTDNNYNISHIDLYDGRGNMVRSFAVTDENEITVYRQGLKSGQYFLKVSGDEDYSMTVIFK